MHLCMRTQGREKATIIAPTSSLWAEPWVACTKIYCHGRLVTSLRWPDALQVGSRSWLNVVSPAGTFGTWGEGPRYRRGWTSDFVPKTWLHLISLDLTCFGLKRPQVTSDQARSDFPQVRKKLLPTGCRLIFIHFNNLKFFVFFGFKRKRELSGIGETGIKSGRRLTAGLVYVMSEF
jgi:hypothetical protein